jgi:hypothetical protein
MIQTDQSTGLQRRPQWRRHGWGSTQTSDTRWRLERWWGVCTHFETKFAERIYEYIHHFEMLREYMMDTENIYDGYSKYMMDTQNILFWGSVWCIFSQNICVCVPSSRKGSVWCVSSHIRKICDDTHRTLPFTFLDEGTHTHIDTPWKNVWHSRAMSLQAIAECTGYISPLHLNKVRARILQLTNITILCSLTLL